MAALPLPTCAKGALKAALRASASVSRSVHGANPGFLALASIFSSARQENLDFRHSSLFFLEQLAAMDTAEFDWPLHRCVLVEYHRYTVATEAGILHDFRIAL